MWPAFNSCDLLKTKYAAFAVALVALLARLAGLGADLVAALCCM